ncbi:hypothetical protein KKD19_04890 [Patescibacteria group bacterium]|nr:hypothetical protein [Patescibacteria group bacterium]MBU4512546.1 hypothetical protein [Patescibacteria group bacterium]MCG2693068.1 hypothetical protein [Candidatus Parcubacteria bacterium]
MRLIRTQSFKADYEKLPIYIREQTEKQLKFFVINWRHPSLRIKKMEGFKNIFEARVSGDYRFTFQVFKDGYILRRIGRHDKTLKHP